MYIRRSTRCLLGKVSHVQYVVCVFRAHNHYLLASRENQTRELRPDPEHMLSIDPGSMVISNTDAHVTLR